MPKAFQKPKDETAFLSMAIYGRAGCGKTFTGLLIAEGLAADSGKRVALVDTERGSSFYSKAVPSRPVHPAAFDFDVLHTRSITDVIAAVQTLKTKDYSVVVIDSITHLWTACIEAYSGKKADGGQIPFHAWARIKEPWKRLINACLNADMHVIFCGREGTEFGKDDDTGELVALGPKMKAEGELAFEPNVLLRLERPRAKPGAISPIIVVVEKDRSGLLAGKTIALPGDVDGTATYDQLGRPLLDLLTGKKHGKLQTPREAATKDAEALDEEEIAQIQNSESLLTQFRAKLDLALTPDQLEEVNQEIQPHKKEMVAADIKALRDHYREALRRVKGAA
jgi:hypothetical protein